MLNFYQQYLKIVATHKYGKTSWRESFLKFHHLRVYSERRLMVLQWIWINVIYMSVSSISMNNQEAKDFHNHPKAHIFVSIFNTASSSQKRTLSPPPTEHFHGPHSSRNVCPITHTDIIRLRVWKARIPGGPICLTYLAKCKISRLILFILFFMNVCERLWIRSKLGRLLIYGQTGMKPNTSARALHTGENADELICGNRVCVIFQWVSKLMLIFNQKCPDYLLKMCILIKAL